MNYTRENLKDSQVKFSFHAEGDVWKNAIKKSYDKTKHKYDVEGFRKGKAPQKVIESRYGMVFLEDALDIVIQEGYSMVLESEKDLIPVARPDVQLTAVSDTEAKFTVTVTVKPEIELGQYTGLEVKKETKKVTEEDIDNKIKQARERAGSWEEIEDRPVAEGDTVDLDYSGSVDGIKFDGGTAENQSLVIGSKTFIPGFEEQLVGTNKGEEKDITVKFPDEYNMEQLKGKEAIFKVKINAIKTKVLPEIDDEFVKDVSEYDTLADYKASIERELQEVYNEQADNQLSNAIVDKVIEGSKMDIPKAMIDSQIDDMVEEFSQRLSYQGMKLEDYFKYTGMKMEDMRVQYQETAKKNIEVRLVLDAIVKKEGFTASEEEIEAKISEMAKDAGKETEEYKKNFTAEYYDYVKNVVVSDKLLGYLKLNNSIIE